MGVLSRLSNPSPSLTRGPLVAHGVAHGPAGMARVFRPGRLSA